MDSGNLTAAYTGVVGSSAAQSNIVIGGTTYTLSKSATVFDYMNINNTTHSKSTNASVGLTAAQSIENGAKVFYVTDSTNTKLITKLITIGAYKGTASDNYIYLSEFESVYENANRRRCVRVFLLQRRSCGLREGSAYDGA
jgi:hypothetical protein